MLLLPAFVLAFFFMYWSLPIACCLYRVRFLSFRDKRDDTYRWSQTIVQFFGAKFKKVGNGELFRSQEPVTYLHNHRSWADFFLDLYVTEGRAAYLSRWAVFPVFPVFLTSALLLKSVRFFNRNKVKDKDAFNKWLDNDIGMSAVKGLIVYPEGHRGLLPESLPLKRGMLKYAYSRSMPCQVVMTSGKELLLSEKRMSVGFNAELALGFSEVVRSTDYPDFEAFWTKIQEVWYETWQTVHNAKTADLDEYVPGQGQDCVTEYPKAVLVGQAAICMTTMSLLLSVVVVGLQLAFSSSLAASALVLFAGMTFLSVQMADLRPKS
jgi:1-acyl-sn-glycerol-3-phosphate acyltransferase